MRWDEMLLDLFEDLEQQAEGLALVERDTEVAELSRAEYAHVTFEDRLHGSTEHHVVLAVAGIGAVAGVLARAGAGWCLVVADDGARPGSPPEWIVPTTAVLRISGLTDRAVDPAARPLTSRLGLGSALRGVAAQRAPVRAHLRDGTARRGRLGRIGADFLEMSLAAEPTGSPEGTGGLRREIIPFAALAALRST